MTHMEPRPNPERSNEADRQIVETANRVARIFGYGNLRIELNKGGGWATERKEQSVVMHVDPDMLRPKELKDATGADTDSVVSDPEAYSLYGICHELGHVEDYMQPTNTRERLKEMTPADAFFWNVLDDAVINRRLRGIPLLNSITSEVYRDNLFPDDDLSTLPKHIQFMYGLLLRNVTPDRAVTLDPAVEEALKSIDPPQKGWTTRRRRTLMDRLSLPRTGFVERRDAATQHILPVYRSLLDEDKADRQQEPGEPGGSQGDPQQGAGGMAEDIYEAYEAAAHGDHEHAHGAEDGAGSGAGDEVADAIQQAGEAMAEVLAEQAAAQPGGKEQGQSASEMAGRIAAELSLDRSDATLYLDALDKYKNEIIAVSRIFQSLALPELEFTSPRYRRHPATRGGRLSPRDLFRAVMATEDEEPVIWRPIETISKKEGFVFSGLDVHLLVDVSGSMRGAKAEAAAACYVVLAEGLELARRTALKQNPMAGSPDVRLQTIAFGASAKVVSPLSFTVDPTSKGTAFSTILRAASGSTMVAGALEETIKSATKDPARTQLVYVLSDGSFSDTQRAQEALASAKRFASYNVCQYILLSPGTPPVVPTYSHVSDVAQLPTYLKAQVRRVTDRYAGE